MAVSMKVHATSSTAAPAASISQNAQSKDFISYFSYGQHTSIILAHIALMIIGWCFILPLAVLLSTGRSRLALPSQFLFLVINALGLLFGIIYNNQTPDLYENNAHHKIGWIVIWVISAQVVLSLTFAFAGRNNSMQSQSRSFNHTTFLAVATDEHECSYPSRAICEYCSSCGRSHGSESNSSIHSPSSPSCESQAGYDGFEKPEELHLKSPSLRGWFYDSFVDRFLLKHMPGIASKHVLRVLNGIYDVTDRIILPLGFTAIASGAVAFGGIFHGIEVFNGLAHFIKGGIFFWYGVITLGRSIGAWADLGWAWNKKPPPCLVGWKAKIPSGEFVESFVIWFYGVTNVFLEHLAGRGKEWSATDMEHASISIMFFGGGLVGMLFESQRIRDALNNTLLPSRAYMPGNRNWHPPESQSVPLNPMPALIILLLGMIMGSHHQDSMTSTMVHKQWGNMFIGFAIARGMTYVLLFLRPPTSYLPTRPPTEIVAAFCLMSGGLIFMLSARQVVEVMEYYELDAMFTFTIGMGFTAFIMSLVVATIGIKALAVKREQTQGQWLFSK